MRHEQGAVRQGEPLRQRWVRFLPRWEKTRTGGVGGPALSPLRMPVVFLLALLASMAVACGDEDATPTPDASGQAPVTPFTDIARLDPYPPRIFQVWNDRPGVVIFDYDRDGDMDMYVTQQGAYENRLYQNGDDGVFTDVAEEAGVEAREYHSTGAVACDFDNDGFQDLYVGSWGNPEDGLDFRSPSDVQGNADRLFRNKGDGTFEDITDSAFGEAVNVRSAASAACADVDGDGWLDIYVGNLGAEDFRVFTTPNHPGHYNVLYRNNGDLTFTDVSERAGVRGPQILMLDPDGEPVLFEDPDTGEKYQGYDPTYRDSMGNRVGEPTGQTHSVLFFDYDEDGDPDLWVANDGDRLHVYRNDSSPGDIRFTPVAGAMGIDKVGSWMGFAVADYDEDGDIDVFVANVGHHLRRWPRQERPGGSCGYHDAFPWGTCLHLLLRNGGVLQDVPGVGPVGTFENVASVTEVAPSPFMPPTSLDPDTLDSSWDVPTGLAAYDFGFGATFFDADNDGDQDLYWLGSTLGRGESLRGHIFQGAGRMLRGDGAGSFEDVTVRARLLDILKVDYSSLSPSPDFDAEARRIATQFHENGKGLAHGDLNGDGYVDLVGTNSSGPITVIEGYEEAAPGPVFVWLNGGGDNHWIKLRLKGRMAVDGTGSNADGVGARVLVETLPRPGVLRVQIQEVRAGSSYLSMDSVDLEFGVGRATEVEEITILWPSGRKQVLHDISVDQVLLIEEPER